MEYLRALLIVVLAISIPLPTSAAAFGAPPCMHHASSVSTSAQKTQSTIAATSAINVVHTNCCCKHCDNCSAPCATGGVATFNSHALTPHHPNLAAPRAEPLTTHLLPAHPEALIRPPVPLRS